MEAEESKVLRLQLELSQYKQEVDRRMGEKDEEFESMRYSEGLEEMEAAWCRGVDSVLSSGYRKNHQRQLEALQQSLEEETKAKNEQSRQKKLADSQLNDLQSQLDATTKVRCKGRKEEDSCPCMAEFNQNVLLWLRVFKIKTRL